MKKNIIVVLLLICGSMGFSQNKQTTFESQDYKELKEFYEKALESGKYKELDELKKEFIDKLGVENFNKIKDSSLLIEDWLNQNWENTAFSSFDEAKELLQQQNKLNAEIKELRKEIIPLFVKLSKEVGYGALFKKLNEDLKQDLLSML